MPYALIPTTGKGSRPDVPESHACVRVAVEMAMIHNVILRAINSIHQQAPYVPLAQQNAFVRYNTVVFGALSHHHDNEERFFFPELDELLGTKGFAQSAVEQHHAFEAGAQDYKAWLDKVEAKQAPYHAEKLRSLLDGFMPILRQHLVDELELLLDLKSLDSDRLATFAQEFQKGAVKGVDPFLLPFLMGGQDTSYLLDDQVELVPIPFFLRFAINWIFYWKHRDLWQFLPSNMQSVKQPLRYAASSSVLG